MLSLGFVFLVVFFQGSLSSQIIGSIDWPLVEATEWFLANEYSGTQKLMFTTNSGFWGYVERFHGRTNIYPEVIDSSASLNPEGDNITVLMRELCAHHVTHILWGEHGTRTGTYFYHEYNIGLFVHLGGDDEVTYPFEEGVFRFTPVRVEENTRNRAIVYRLEYPRDCS